MRTLLLPLLALSAATLVSSSQGTAQGRPSPEVLVRLDDIGMNHSLNLAMQEVAERGIPFSTSVLFVGPWYQEAVEILRKHPEVSVGVHLALNSEWKNYRWGPVLGQAAVPSLVDSVGYFRPSVEDFLRSRYDLGEVERELSAQVERALKSGLKIDYVDYHMGTAVSTPQLRAVVERVAKKYHLGISRYFGEEGHELWGEPVDQKKARLLEVLNGMKQDRPNLVVFHVAKQMPEMDALIDENAAEQNVAGGGPGVSAHRQAELQALLSPEFASWLREGRARAITYRELIARDGLEAMHAPADGGS